MSDKTVALLGVSALVLIGLALMNSGDACCADCGKGGACSG